METATPTLSKGLITECKKLKITPQEKAFADLLNAGWKEKDSYLVTGLYKHLLSEEANTRNMRSLLAKDTFTEYMEELEKDKKYIEMKLKEVSQTAITTAPTTEVLQVTEEDISNELSKDAQLKELITAKKAATIGSKEWLDIKKMIADITQVKKEEIKDEASLVHYYLPLTCNVCSLYNKNKTK